MIIQVKCLLCLMLGMWQTLNISYYCYYIFSAVLGNHRRCKRAKIVPVTEKYVLQHPHLPLSAHQTDLCREAPPGSAESLDLCPCSATLQPYASAHHLTSLNLSFLFCKMEIMIRTLQLHKITMRFKCDYV